MVKVSAGMPVITLTRTTQETNCQVLGMKNCTLSCSTGKNTSSNIRDDYTNMWVSLRSIEANLTLCVTDPLYVKLQSPQLPPSLTLQEFWVVPGPQNSLWVRITWKQTWLLIGYTADKTAHHYPLPTSWCVSKWRAVAVQPISQPPSQQNHALTLQIMTESDTMNLLHLWYKDAFAGSLTHTHIHTLTRTQCKCLISKQHCFFIKM